jgi:hypothetical protein
MPVKKWCTSSAFCSVSEGLRVSEKLHKVASVVLRSGLIRELSSLSS